MILNNIIAIKSEDLDDNLPSWKWLQRLIKTLGEDGMSSEESSVENSVTNILRVKNMDWRRNIEKELEIIDLQRVIDKDIFSLQGSRPLPRKCAPDNPVTSLLILDHVTSGLTKPPCCLGSAQLKENMTKPGFEPRTSWHIPRCSNH